MELSTIASISTVASGIAAVIGILAVAVQVRGQRVIARAQFINELATDIDRNIDTESKLDPEGEYYELAAAISGKDKEGIEQYLNFFERLYYIIEESVIDIATADGLFAHRFFMLAHNPNVIEHVLFDPAMKPYFLPFFRLHKMWYEYRKKNYRDIPRADNAAIIRSNNEHYPT